MGTGRTHTPFHTTLDSPPPPPEKDPQPLPGMKTGRHTPHSTRRSRTPPPTPTWNEDGGGAHRPLPPIGRPRRARPARRPPLAGAVPQRRVPAGEVDDLGGGHGVVVEGVGRGRPPPVAGVDGRPALPRVAAEPEGGVVCLWVCGVGWGSDRFVVFFLGGGGGFLSLTTPPPPSE